jgi:hypothetical protein
MPLVISVAALAGNSDVVVVVSGAGALVVVVVVVVVPGLVVVSVDPLLPVVELAADVVVGATVVVVRGTAVVVDSKTCSGAVASCDLPWKIARIAFMLSPSSVGTMTDEPPIT